MKKTITILFGAFLSLFVNAQALRGTSGLLHAPSADMQKIGTFMVGGNVLDVGPLDFYWSRDEDRYTYDYYINVTVFPFLEVGYTCTLNYATPGSTYWPPQTWGHHTNQDRSFNTRVRLWKEGWFKWWTPQIVLGLDDFLSHMNHGGGQIVFDPSNTQSRHFTRYYIAASKHLDFENVGSLGVHLGVAYHLKRNFYGPTAGATFRFALPENNKWIKALNGLELIAEYDARTVNVGIRYSCINELLHFVVECNDLAHLFRKGEAYWSGGVYFSIPLLNKETFAQRPDYRIGHGANRPRWDD